MTSDKRVPDNDDTLAGEDLPRADLSDMDPSGDAMPLAEYLRSGGRLTSPHNVPPRYRADLMRLMATFVDSALAGAAGFAERINDGPGVRARIAAARIVMEKMRNAERVLAVMAEFGANTTAYVTHHPWTERLPRDSDIGASRQATDMRLSVFHYPLAGWTDAVVMNVLMGTAVEIQLAEFSRISYQPLAEAFRDIAVVEAQHTALGQRGLAQILTDRDEREAVEVAIDYWTDRVESSFGLTQSARFEQLRDFGLRFTPNAELADAWRQRMGDELRTLGLSLSA